MSDAAVKLLLAYGYQAQKTSDGVTEWQAAGFAIESTSTVPVITKGRS
jgi:hypothetical protein